MRTLAVLALAIQCLVIQTHFDAPAIGVAASAGHAQTVSAQTRDDQDQGRHRLGGACVVCQAAANARVGLATPTMVLRLAEPVDLPVALVTVAQHAPRIPAHAWQSRAPPLHI